MKKTTNSQISIRARNEQEKNEYLNRIKKVKSENQDIKRTLDILEQGLSTYDHKNIEFQLKHKKEMAIKQRDELIDKLTEKNEYIRALNLQIKNPEINKNPKNKNIYENLSENDKVLNLEGLLKQRSEL